MDIRSTNVATLNTIILLKTHEYNSNNDGNIDVVNTDDIKYVSLKKTYELLDEFHRINGKATAAKVSLQFCCFSGLFFIFIFTFTHTYIYYI